MGFPTGRSNCDVRLFIRGSSSVHTWDLFVGSFTGSKEESSDLIPRDEEHCKPGCQLLESKVWGEGVNAYYTMGRFVLNFLVFNLYPPHRSPFPFTVILPNFLSLISLENKLLMSERWEGSCLTSEEYEMVSDCSIDRLLPNLPFLALYLTAPHTCVKPFCGYEEEFLASHHAPSRQTPMLVTYPTSPKILLKSLSSDAIQFTSF